MITLINTTVSESRSVARLWVEGNKLSHAGIEIGQRYIVEVNESDQRIELRLAPDDYQGKTINVSKRTRNSRLQPLIELRDDILEKLFGIGQKVRVAIRKARIVVTQCHVTKRITERVKRFNDKISKKMPLSVSSFFMGGGVLDAAVHEGLELAGHKSFVKVAVELESQYIDSALANSPQLFNDESIVINSDLRDLNVLGGNLPKVEVCLAGIPCTGASLSGLSKNKLRFAEEHNAAGSLFVYFLDYVKVMNPAIVLIENVTEYMNTASLSVIRSVLTHLGYELAVEVLEGNKLGTLENRKRMCLVATTPGACDKVDFDQLMPVREKEATLNEILEDIPESSDRWKSYSYLADKEIRDKKAGKGFARQLLTGSEEYSGVAGRGYNKVRSTEPQIVSPYDSTKSRLFTVNEHAAVKGIPKHIVEGLSDTVAHEVLGQSVCYPAFVAVGKLIGQTINSTAKSVTQATKTVSNIKAVLQVNDISQSRMFA